MKLVSTNTVVGKSSINAVPVRTFDDGSAQALAQAGRIGLQIANAQAHGNEAAGRMYNALGRTIGQVGAVIQHQQEQTDAVNAQAASNEYTKRVNELLYNPDNGLMNTKFEGASNVTTDFTEQEKKIREEVYGQYHFHTAKGQQAFNRLADNSAAQRYTMLQRHQYQQAEAYKDVTYNNGLQMNMQTAADNYMAPDIVDDNIKEAIMSTRARLFGQGDEVIRQAERKAVGAIAQQVINRSYANGDTSGAESYIEKYGSYMDPQTLTGYAKNVYQSRMETMQEVSAKTLFSQFGDNLQAAYDHIFSDGFSGNGNSNSSVAWFKDMSDRGEGWGVNTCTKGVNAALEAGGFKPIPCWAPTAWDQEHAAGRTFTNRNQLRNGDIVYWDSAGDGDASHVGIYDAKTGMVYQSGTSGFRPIALDTYKLIGFSHPQGRAASPAEKKKLWNAYRQEVALNKQFEAQREQDITDQLDSEFFQMYKNGVTDPETFRAAVVQRAGDDPKLFRKLTSLAGSYARVAKGAAGSGSGSSGSGKSDPLLEYKITNMLNNGVGETAILDFMDNPDNGFTAQDKKKTLDVLEKRRNGEGQFKFDLASMKDAIMADYKAKDKSYAWGNVQQYLIYQINEYRAQHGGQDPDRATVAQWGREALVDGISYQVPGRVFGTNTVTTNEAEAAAHGIMRVTNNPAGGKNIVLRDGRSINVTDAQFARIIQDNMSVEEAINAG